MMLNCFSLEKLNPCVCSFVDVNSKYSSRDAKSLSSSSGKASSFSLPQTPRSEGEILQSSNIKNFSYSDLKTATRNFRPDSVLGEGGFGSVFKGWVDEHSLTSTRPGTGMLIAVKRLNQEGFQGHKEWLVSFKSGPSNIFTFIFHDRHQLLIHSTSCVKITPKFHIS